jgi:hypothetical protein
MTILVLPREPGSECLFTADEEAAARASSGTYDGIVRWVVVRLPILSVVG